MTFVARLSFGWSLWYEPTRARPYFRDPHGIDRQPFEVASQVDSVRARVLFRDVFRLKRIADHERPRHGDGKWTSLHAAKDALEFSLKIAGRWGPELLESDVVGAR